MNMAMEFEITGLNIITSDFGSLDNDFWVNLQVDISEVGGNGAEVFNINVVGCERLNRITQNESLIGRGIIISKSYDEASVRFIVEKLVQKIKANSWEEFYNEFSKYF